MLIREEEKPSGTGDGVEIEDALDMNLDTSAPYEKSFHLLDEQKSKCKHSHRCSDKSFNSDNDFADV